MIGEGRLPQPIQSGHDVIPRRNPRPHEQEGLRQSGTAAFRVGIDVVFFSQELSVNVRSSISSSV
jgi:hypothetical protein